MTCITTRTVTLHRDGSEFTSIPAGTEVYVRPRRKHLEIRLPGTLFVQTVSASAIRPA